VKRRRLHSGGQIVGTVLPVVNLIAYSEPGTQLSYSSLMVTVDLSRFVSEIFACDRRPENADHCYSCGRSNLSAVFPEISQLASAAQAAMLFTRPTAARHASCELYSGPVSTIFSLQLKLPKMAEPYVR